MLSAPIISTSAATPPSASTTEASELARSFRNHLPAGHNRLDDANALNSRKSLRIEAQSGFYYVNPLTAIWRHSVLLRVRNFESQKLKVNDSTGSPIQIAAVVVWRVVDTAKAIFDVQAFEEYVLVQSETALRHVASQFPYDSADEGPSLLGGGSTITEALRTELQDRLAVAGIDVLEARLTHLAYAPEIAEAMLRRQQAAAIVAARRTIVEGAVGIVDSALRQLSEQETVQLDEQRKAAMAANLLLVLTSDRGPTPTIDAGS